MKNRFLFSFLLVLTVLFSSCEQEVTSVQNESIDSHNLDLLHLNQEYFLVANRGSSTISVFDGKTTDFISDITLPDSGAQPTYLAHSERNDAVYVGDFANSKVVYYDSESLEYEGEIAIGQGAFHMWINNRVNQLWVNNIVSKTTSVINLNTNTLIADIPLPTVEIPELTANAVQHDVTISTNGRLAYVTVLDGSDTSYVVMYDTTNLEYIKHEVVGGDAHLLSDSERLYVPSQNDGIISVFKRRSLTLFEEIPFASAHGVINSRKFVFTTGIADNKVGVINRFTNQVVSEIDTDFNIPHNLAVNRRGKILFLSHSGGSQTKVVFYGVQDNGNLTKLSEYDSGLNPFGVLSYRN